MILEILQVIGLCALALVGFSGGMFGLFFIHYCIDYRLHPEKYAPPTYKPMFADEWEEMAFYDDVLADGLPFFGDR